MDGRISRMDRIASNCTPFIFLLLIDDRISPLEITGVLEQRIVFVRDVLAANALLDDFITPVVVEPGLSHDFLFCSRFQKGVGCARNVKVDLQGMSDFIWNAFVANLVVDNMIM